GKALFIGLYKIAAAVPITYDKYWSLPENKELKNLGMRGFEGDRPSVLLFDLPLADFYKSWKGKLIVDWPPPERSWWRRAHRNDITIHAILEDSTLDDEIKDWRKIDFTWGQLSVLPTRRKAQISEWRAIYYIFDVSDKKGYVGSAYGADNLLGRWLNYAASGHGGNRLLRGRDPQNFRFTILERVSPDMDSESVTALESTWKERLHTRDPFGLNDN
ncbi:MAG TPA: GIY-YIG nuclease family protein, partial [Rhizomicrobium sp.]|nr:GIY-YIG nuclease family protein [Rhizomicrobium sp.]